VLDESPNGTLRVEASTKLASDVHTLAFDGKTGKLWTVWAEPKGDFVQQLILAQ
jgi:hypothetical protein